MTEPNENTYDLSPETPAPPVGASGRVRAAQPIPVYMPQAGPARGGSRGSAAGAMFRYFMSLIFVLSIGLNVYLIVILGSKLQEHVYMAGNEADKIALIDLAGTINMETAADLRQKLKRAAEDDSVKGIILVVNSPGGQVAPSNMVNRYITDICGDKPIYSVIQQVGASGAYWISVATDKIYAQRNSVVGSIGVIYLNLIVQQALEEKLGVNPVVVKSSRSPFKDHNSMFRMPTDEEKKDIQEDLDKIHEQFVEVVSRGRSMTVDEVWPLANGDVHDGPEALDKHLVDKVGYLEDAIDDMAEELGIYDPHVVRYVDPPSFMEVMTASQAAALNDPLDIKAQLEKLAGAPRIQALWLGN